jgi:hypothetical protein
LSIPSKGINEAALFGCGKLSGSTQRKECPAQTVKVFFDQMAAILPHQFDGHFS